MLHTPIRTYTTTDIAMNISSTIDTIEKELEADARKGFTSEPFGKSGNMKLPVACAYCPFKKHCWANSNSGKGLRTFLYSFGPVHLTDVKNEPKVPELKDVD